MSMYKVTADFTINYGGVSKSPLHVNINKGSFICIEQLSGSSINLYAFEPKCVLIYSGHAGDIGEYVKSTSVTVEQWCKLLKITDDNIIHLRPYIENLTSLSKRIAGVKFPTLENLFPNIGCQAVYDKNGIKIIGIKKGINTDTLENMKYMYSKLVNLGDLIGINYVKILDEKRSLEDLGLIIDMINEYNNVNTKGKNTFDTVGKGNNGILHRNKNRREQSSIRKSNEG